MCAIAFIHALKKFTHFEIVYNLYTSSRDKIKFQHNFKQCNNTFVLNGIEKLQQAISACTELTIKKIK